MRAAGGSRLAAMAHPAAADRLAAPPATPGRPGRGRSAQKPVPGPRRPGAHIRWQGRVPSGIARAAPGRRPAPRHAGPAAVHRLPSGRRSTPRPPRASPGSARAGCVRRRRVAQPPRSVGPGLDALAVLGRPRRRRSACGWPCRSQAGRSAAGVSGRDLHPVTRRRAAAPARPALRCHVEPGLLLVRRTPTAGTSAPGCTWCELPACALTTPQPCRLPAADAAAARPTIAPPTSWGPTSPCGRSGRRPRPRRATGAAGAATATVPVAPRIVLAATTSASGSAGDYTRDAAVGGGHLDGRRVVRRVHLLLPDQRAAGPRRA